MTTHTTHMVTPAIEKFRRGLAFRAVETPVCALSTGLPRVVQRHERVLERVVRLRECRTVAAGAAVGGEEPSSGNHLNLIYFSELNP